MPRSGQKKDVRQGCLFDEKEQAVHGHSGPDYARMNCDGASSGNPGKAGIGVVIQVPEGLAARLGIETGYSISRYIGETTNNVAEYTALIEGLQNARALGIRKIRVSLDSELIVRQMKGQYRVKQPHLIPLFEKVKALISQFDSCRISHVPREMNKEADALARKGGKGS